MTNYVPPSGPLDAKIALVGEAPGQEEINRGEPFVGPSGRLLSDMLAAAGISRQQCYLTNVSKQRPPNNDFGVFYADKKRQQPSTYLLQCYQDLREELLRVNPNIVVPLGSEPLKAITGRTSIESWRGSLLSSPVGKVCGTYHPAYVLRQYIARTTVELDFRRVSQESTSPELRLPSHTFDISPTFEQVCTYLRHRPKRLAFDIETSGTFVRCLGLSSRSDHAICIPFMAASSIETGIHSSVVGGPLQTPTRNSYWTVEQEWEILRLLDELFLDPSVQKIAQNFPFDALVLSREFGLDTSPGLHMDTMVAHHACYSELPKGLDYLASVYTRVPYYSDFDAGSDRQTWIYNCYDAAVTYEISERLDQELVDCGMAEFYRNQIQPALLAYTRAETRGVRIDETLRIPERAKVEQEVTQLTAQIIAQSAGVIQNPNSTQQLQKYLYDVLKLPVQYNHKTKQPSLDKHARATLASKFPDHAGIIEVLDRHSTKSTLLTFFDRAIEGGRVKTHYNVAGTKTWRLSSGKDKELGDVTTQGAFGLVTNLQNVPRGAFRRLFVPEPGWLFVKADLSQAEFRIVVWKARIRRIIEKYLHDPLFDCHTMLASWIFNKPESQIERKRSDGKPSERDISKNGVYGGQYGMYYTTAARTYKLPLQTAKFVLDRFHSLLPEVERVFWAEVQQQLLLNNRVLENEMGLRRIFLDRMEQDLFREAYSHSAQSLVGSLINRAFALVDDIWDPTIAYPLLQVHDEIVAMARESEAVGIGRQLKAFMEYPLVFRGVPEPLVIPAEVAIGRNWYDVKPLEIVEKEGLSCLS